MRFKKVTLYTHKLEEEFMFYSQNLGCKILKKSDKTFSIQVGWSELCFEKSDCQHLYHYCFLIPANMLDRALVWMEQKVDIIEIENGRKTQNFKDWNANSFYFHDASGNIVEFIARHDLRNESKGEFDISSVIGFNEMGMPTRNILQVNQQLEKELHTKFWKGEFNRFGTNGTQEGLFLLPNYELKEVWFPTSIQIKPEPFKAIVENNEWEFQLIYRYEEVKIQELTK